MKKELNKIKKKLDDKWIERLDEGEFSVNDFLPTIGAKMFVERLIDDAYELGTAEVRKR